MRTFKQQFFVVIEYFDPWLFFLIGATLTISLTPDARAQPNAKGTPPHVAFVYPAGGRQGATFTVSVGGQNLNATAAVHFSGRGLTAKISGYERPLTQKEINDLRDEQQALQDKRAAVRADTAKPAFTAENEKRSAEIRTLLATRGNRQLSPVLAETVTLEVTIGPEAVPGEHELRVRTPGGLSNPMVFCVGQLQEFTEPARIATSPASGARPKRDGDPRNRHLGTGLEVTLPATVNGQILPGEVDRIQFTATRGQRIVLVAAARTLIPYLADAVPGWFQATLGLFDDDGRELAYADDYRFNPDPILRYDIPADGRYVIEIKDAIYRGREDFVYRIAVGELPFVTSIFPLGGPSGSRASFDLAGWNLSGTKLEMDTTEKRPGTFFVSVRNQHQLSNSVRISLDGQLDCFEAEPNDRPDLAQPIALPIALNGRIDRPGDQDVFRFNGKAGDEIVAEVFARRLGSPLDSVLKLNDADGKQIAVNDDHEDKSYGLLTHHADSRIACKLPADGDYFLTLADTQHQGGNDYGYRLRVGPPQPDFDLRVTPSTINVRAGASTAVTVYALRRDGFSGEITLQLRDAPWGFGLSGGRIPANQEKIQVTVTAPYRASDEVFGITLVGFATIGGKTVGHTVIPCEDMMQAFSYKHLVAAKDLLVDVTGRGAPFRVVTKGPLRLVPGGKTRLQIAAPSTKSVGKIHFDLLEAPEGISIQQTSEGTGDTINVTIACAAGTTKRGPQGNLLLSGFGERPTANPAAKTKANQRVPLGAVPAIPFEIVAPST